MCAHSQGSGHTFGPNHKVKGAQLCPCGVHSLMGETDMKEVLLRINREFLKVLSAK